MSSSALTPILSVCTASLIWGAAYTANKVSLDYGSPAQMLLFQMIGSVCFLTVVCLLQGVSSAEIRQALRLWWTGLLEPGLTYFLGITGLQSASAGTASIIVSSEAIVVLLIMAALGWELITREFALLSVVSFVGIGLTVFEAQPDMGSGHGGFHGELLLCIATLSAAVYAVASDRMMAQQRPLVVVTVQQFASFVFAAVVCAIGGFRGESIMLDVRPALWLAASGITQYSLAFLLFLYALKHLSASLTSVYLNLIPIFAVVTSVSVLHESLSLLQGVGCAMVVGSLLVLSYRKMRDAKDGGQPGSGEVD